MSVKTREGGGMKAVTVRKNRLNCKRQNEYIALTGLGHLDLFFYMFWRFEIDNGFVPLYDFGGLFL